MADIDSIIAGVGGGTRADFANFDPGKAFFDASKARSDFDTRRAFQNGIPTIPDGQPGAGQPDFGAIGKTFFQKGAIEQGIAASNLALQQSKLKFGQDADAVVNPPSTSDQPIVGPSTSRNSVTIDPSKRAGASTPQPQSPQPSQRQPMQGSPQGDQPGSIVGLVSSAGIPDELAGPVIQQVSAMTRTDPNATLNPDVAQRVQQVVQAAVQRMRGGQGAPQPASPMQAAPPQVAQAAPQAAPQVQAPQGFPAQSGATDPRFVGLVPAGRTPDLQVHLLQKAIGSGLLSPGQEKSYQSAIDAIRKAAEPTDDMKAAASVGQNVAEFNRSKEETKNDVTRFAKQADGIDASAAAATSMLPHLQLARSLMSQPSFYSGTGEGVNLAYKRAIAAFGGDPNASLPQEGFRKVMAANILDQVAQLKAETAASGGGSSRIFQSQIALMEKAAQNPDNSIAANRLLTEMGFRAAKRAQDIANMADNYNGGHLNPQFNMKLRQWNADHPMFTPEEMADPRVIAPAEFKDSRSAFDAKLPKGTPLKIAGKLKWVQ